MTLHVLRLIWNRKRTNGLLMVEIFFAFLVLFAVTALGVYMGSNWLRPVGFSTDDLWIVSVDMKGVGTPAEQTAVMERVTAALHDMPQVVGSAGIGLPPYWVGASTRDFEFRGRLVSFGNNEVTDAFKDVIGLRIIEGRWFGPEDDGASYDPVVINADMARELFPREPAVGQRLSPEQTASNEPLREQRVVGVLEAYREDGEFDGQRWQALYRKGQRVPHAVGTRPTFGSGEAPLGNLVVRVQPGTTAAFEEAALRRLQAVARDWSFEMKPLAESRASMMRLALAPLAAIGLVAAFLMLMVALGLTGVLWQSVTQRTRELGLRRAAGATRAAVQRQVLGELVVMTGLALAAGAVVVAQLPLLGVIPWVDPAVYGVGLMISAATITALTVVCGWYPSRMATRIEPADALRYE
jgi:putative ABC transport system permease protein